MGGKKKKKKSKKKKKRDGEEPHFEFGYCSATNNNEMVLVTNIPRVVDGNEFVNAVLALIGSNKTRNSIANASGHQERLVGLHMTYVSPQLQKARMEFSQQATADKVVKLLTDRAKPPAAQNFWKHLIRHGWNRLNRMIVERLHPEPVSDEERKKNIVFHPSRGSLEGTAAPPPVPRPDNEQWYWIHPQEGIARITWGNLRKAIASGKATPATEVRQATLYPSWTPICEVEELRESASSAPGYGGVALVSPTQSLLQANAARHSNPYPNPVPYGYGMRPAGWPRTPPGHYAIPPGTQAFPPDSRFGFQSTMGQSAVYSPVPVRRVSSQQGQINVGAGGPPPQFSYGVPQHGYQAPPAGPMQPHQPYHMHGQAANQPYGLDTSGYGVSADGVAVGRDSLVQFGIASPARGRGGGYNQQQNFGNGQNWPRYFGNPM